MLGILLCAFLSAGVATAQNVESVVSVDSVSVGDRFNLTVFVGHDGTRNALFPHNLRPDSLNQLQAPFALGDLEIIRLVKQGRRPYASGGQIDSVVYEVTTFALDTARVAGIPVGLSTEIDTLFGMGAPLEVRVTSLVPADASEIKDILPLAEFPRSWWPWIVGVLAVLAVIAGIWWWRRNTEEEATEEMPSTPDTPPYDEAVQRLTRLESFDLNDPDSIKPFYVELTDILRTYVGRRAHIPALESTTRELMERLRQLVQDDILTSGSTTGDSMNGNNVTGNILVEIDTVLSHADLVKFADLKPLLEQTRAMVAETRGAIDDTETVFRKRDAARRLEEQRLKEAETYAPPGKVPDEEVVHP